MKLRERRPEYAYKEATLNPTNPRDRAADWEADIIQRFRNDATAREVIGERDTPMGKSLYLARPIRTESGCAACHSTPAIAPPTLLARYGRDNGFGWQDDEIVGAQIVSVPSGGYFAVSHRGRDAVEEPRAFFERAALDGCVSFASWTALPAAVQLPERLNGKAPAGHGCRRSWSAAGWGGCRTQGCPMLPQAATTKWTAALRIGAAAKGIAMEHRFSNSRPFGGTGISLVTLANNINNNL